MNLIHCMRTKLIQEVCMSLIQNVCRTLDFANGPRSAAQPAPQSPHHPLSTLGASDPPQRAACGHTVAFLSHADSACAMLTCCSACRRTMRGRIFESKNISHIGVDSARRACHLRRGRARAREAVARGLGRSVLCRVLCVSSSGAQDRASRLRMHFVVAHV